MQTTKKVIHEIMLEDMEDILKKHFGVMDGQQMLVEYFIGDSDDEYTPEPVVESMRVTISEK